MVIELSNVQQTTKVRPRSATLITDTGGIVNRAKQASLGATAEAARGVAANARIQEQSSLAHAQAFARVGQAVQNAGDAAFKIITAKRKEDEEREVNQGLIKFADLRQTKMAELFSLKGNAALQRSQEIADELSQAKEEIRAEMSTQRGQHLADASLSLKLTDAKGSISKYHTQQRDVANKLTAAAKLFTAINEAAENPADLTALESSVRTAEESARTKTQGFNDTIVEAQIEENQSKVMESAITSAIKNKNYLLARALLDKKGQYENVPDVVGTAKASLRKTLQEVELVDRVHNTVDMILVTPLDETEALAEGDLVVEGHLRKEVKQEIRLRFSDKDRATTRKRQEEKLELLGFAQETVNRLKIGGATQPEVMAKIRSMDASPQKKDAAVKEALAQFREDDVAKTRARQNKAFDNAAAVNDAVSSIIGGTRSESAALLQAQKRFNDDPDALKKAEARITKVYAARERDKDRTRETSAGKATRFVGEGKTFDQFKEENPEDWNILSEKTALVNEIEKYEKQVEQGKFFAKIDNNVKFDKWKLMADHEIVEVSPEELRRNLTKPSYDKMINKIQTAKRRIENPAEARFLQNMVRKVVDDFSIETFETRRGAIGKRVVLNKDQIRDVRVRLEDFVTDFKSREENKGKNPTQTEVEKEAQKIILSLKAVSDPRNTGLFFTPSNPGEKVFDDISKFMNSMSKEQKAVARVPMSSIPADIKRGLEAKAKEGGVKVVYPLLIESLAAAYAVDDKKRFDKLINNAANPERQIGTEAE
tara:strand:+ start:5954 stop:8263 length:2310 start_codon:yes stop_codon:yes gene_type:complete